MVIKGRDRLWPTVTWTDSNLSIQYLGSEDDDVTIRETNTLDFEEFFLHLDRGGSIFLTVKPDTPDRYDGPHEETGFRRAQKKNLPELAETLLDRGEGLSATNLEPEEIRSWK
ncbi:hypothetical protein ISS39_08185 [Candidatus Bathyarchaeota archaeon]|nr:hypothetical protein [Candidatus Bathyarchaeota archaeon]